MMIKKYCSPEAKGKRGEVLMRQSSEKRGIRNLGLTYGWRWTCWVSWRLTLASLFIMWLSNEIPKQFCQQQRHLHILPQAFVALLVEGTMEAQHNPDLLDTGVGFLELLRALPRAAKTQFTSVF